MSMKYDPSLSFYARMKTKDSYGILEQFPIYTSLNFSIFFDIFY